MIHVQNVYNTLMHKVAHDHDFLSQCLSRYAHVVSFSHECGIEANSVFFFSLHRLCKLKKHVWTQHFRVIEVDDFTRRLWNIYVTVREEGISQVCEWLMLKRFSETSLMISCEV